MCAALGFDAISSWSDAPLGVATLFVPLSLLLVAASGVAVATCVAASGVAVGTAAASGVAVATCVAASGVAAGTSGPASGGAGATTADPAEPIVVFAEPGLARP